MSEKVYKFTQVKKTNMERTELYDWLERIIEVLGPEETLEAIVRAMGSDELESMLEFIDRVYEISAETS